MDIFIFKDKAEGKAHKIFNFLDIDGNGEIDENEFIQGCLLDEEMTDILSSGTYGMNLEVGENEVPTVIVDEDKKENSDRVNTDEKCI